MDYDSTMCNNFWLSGHWRTVGGRDGNQTSGEYHWHVTSGPATETGLGESGVGKGNLRFPGEEPAFVFYSARCGGDALPRCD